MSRIQMRLLLLGLTGLEPSFRTWCSGLECAGVPFSAVALRTGGVRNTIALSGGRPRFQAVIFATSACLAALSHSDRDALELLERQFGIRRLIAYAYPGPAVGLRSPRWAGRFEGVPAWLTTGGREIFPYLRGPLMIDAGGWGYLAPPASSRRFEPLVAGPTGSALVGIDRLDDGREVMVQTFDMNAGQTHGQLLRRGQLAWLTRGTYLGYERNYLSLQIDDVLLPNYAWSVADHATARGSGTVIRMTADDAARAAAWSRARGLRLDLACNGAGSERHARELGIEDPLLRALVDGGDAFGWINHTYKHLNLDRASRAAIETEIEGNRDWARRWGIELEPDALITGEHTGLANLAVTPEQAENPGLAAAMAATGIRYLACDASRPYPISPLDPAGQRWRPGTPFAIGPALAVPRYPTLLASDASTEAQAMDRLRCAGIARPDSWDTILDAEARRIFGLVIGNDPRPHYFHQSNLVAGPLGPDRGGGIFYALIDRVLALYRRYMTHDVAIKQPTLSQIGQLLSRWSSWRAAVAAGAVRGEVDGSHVTIRNDAGAAVDVPVTGTEIGQLDGDARSGWLRVGPGETVLESA